MLRPHSGVEHATQDDRYDSQLSIPRILLAKDVPSPSEGRVAACCDPTLPSMIVTWIIKNVACDPVYRRRFD